jgi:hypothetical protein
MKVSELIRLLKHVPQNYEVFTEYDTGVTHELTEQLMFVHDGRVYLCSDYEQPGTEGKYARNLTKQPQFKGGRPVRDAA